MKSTKQYQTELGQTAYAKRESFLTKLLADHNYAFAAKSSEHFCKLKFDACYRTRTSKEWNLSREESFTLSAQVLLDMPNNGRGGMAIDLALFQNRIEKEHARQFNIYKRKHQNNNSIDPIIPRHTYNTVDIMPEHKQTHETTVSKIIANDLATLLAETNKLWGRYLTLVWFNDRPLDQADARKKLGITKMQFESMRNGLREAIARYYDEAKTLLLDVTWAKFQLNKSKEGTAKDGQSKRNLFLSSNH